MTMLDTRLARANGQILEALGTIEDILIDGVDPQEVPALQAAVAQAYDGALEVEAVKVDQKICRYIETHGWDGTLGTPLRHEIIDLAQARAQRRGARPTVLQTP